MHFFLLINLFFNNAFDFAGSQLPIIFGEFFVFLWRLLSRIWSSLELSLIESLIFRIKRLRLLVLNSRELHFDFDPFSRVKQNSGDCGGNN